MVCEVWAPEASQVELVLGRERRPMTKGERGWWSLDEPQLQPGSDYWFEVDGEGPYPDPRSPSQPEGVNGPSRALDHSDFKWSDSGWRQPPLQGAVIYELHVGTFTAAGTFAAAAERLEHLLELGITHIELMPVQEFSGDRGWGYDGVDLYAPHHSYGGPDGLKAFVDQCHQVGMAVILDVVYNHFGPAGNYLSRFGPYVRDVHTTLWGDAVNLDGPGSDVVRRFICDNALQWLRDYHVDGLRLDAVHALVDLTATHLLEQLREEVRRLEERTGRRYLLIAEDNQNNPRIPRDSAAGGYGLDASWVDDFHHSLHVALTAEQDGYYQDFQGLADLERVLQQGYAYDGRYSSSRDLSYGRPAEGLDGRSFVGFLQNHDQVGNRAQGERISHLVPIEAAMAGAALLLTSPLVPLLFQGEEWAASSPFLYFTDHGDSKLGRNVRRGRRREFEAEGSVPDPQAADTFHRSRLVWTELEDQPHRRVLEWYRQLIRLRRSSKDLQAGGWAEVRSNPRSSWIAMSRGRHLVLVNLAKRKRTVPTGPEDANWEQLLSSDERSRLSPAGAEMAPHSAMILKRKAGT